MSVESNQAYTLVFVLRLADLSNCQVIGLVLQHSIENRSIYLFIYLFVHLFIYLFILFIYLFIYLLFGLSGVVLASLVVQMALITLEVGVGII